MWQVAGFGPVLGQTHRFRTFATEKTAAIERCTDEANRRYGVLNRRLTHTGTWPASFTNFASAAQVLRDPIGALSDAHVAMASLAADLRVASG